MAEEWHYVIGGTSQGPFTTLEVEGLIARGQIGPATLVWNPSLPVWEPASQHFSFQNAMRADHPPTGLGPDGLYVGAPSRGFREAFEVCIKKYATFSGRASRSEYWYFILWLNIFGAVAQPLDVAFWPAAWYGPLSSLVLVAFALPSLAVSWRRLHDTDRSGWWLVGFYVLVTGTVIPVVGLVAETVLESPYASPDEAIFGILGLMVFGIMIYGIVLLVFYCTRGTPGPNRYG